MREAILIGRKGTAAKVISDVLPFDKAREQLNGYRLSSSGWPKDAEVIELQPIGIASRKATKTVVIGRETYPARQEKLANELTAAAEKEVAEAAKDNAAAKKSKGAGKAALIGACLLLGLNLHAQDSINLGVTSVAETNSTPSQAYNWTKDDALVLQVTAYGDVADATNITLDVDISVDGINWTNTAASIELPQDGTNVVTHLVLLTNDWGARKWRIGTTATPLTNTLTISSAKYIVEEP